jgi:hypothetical protein
MFALATISEDRAQLGQMLANSPRRGAPEPGTSHPRQLHNGPHRAVVVGLLVLAFCGYAAFRTGQAGEIASGRRLHAAALAGVAVGVALVLGAVLWPRRMS